MLIREEFSKKMLHFYDSRRRILPWREDPHPYRVWISEIMLQQTRVETVIPYFERFMKEYPSVSKLAEAEEERLLKLWEGLGYYSRIRNIHRAAREIANRFDSRIPSDKEELLELPGIGPYTAGAILSIAYGKKEIAVDGNMIRIAARITALEEIPTKGEGKRAVEEFLREVIPEDRAGDFNQAMMDLGATICLPNGAPLCAKCPVSDLCLSFYQGNPESYPKKEPKKERRIEKHTVFILSLGNKTAFIKRERTGLLAGLWGFPMKEGHLSKAEALEYLFHEGFPVKSLSQGIKAKHIFSHVEWHMISYEAELEEMAIREGSNLTWFTPEESEEISFPTAYSKYRDRLREKSMREYGDIFSFVK